MSRITKAIATLVATKLAEPARKEKDECFKLLENTVLRFKKANTPMVVRKAYEKHPEYILTGKKLKLVGNGFNHEIIKTTKPFMRSGSSYYEIFEPSKAKAEILLPLFKKHTDSCKKYKELISQIEIALITLKTYSRIKKEFPEAYKLLPEKQVAALAIPIKEVKAKLEEYRKA